MTSIRIPAAKRCLRVVTLGVIVLSTLCANAQSGGQTGDSIEGTAADSSGNMLPRAAVKVRNDATGAIVSATTDTQGHFAVAGLAAGRYTVEASAPGFSPSPAKT